MPAHGYEIRSQWGIFPFHPRESVGRVAIAKRRSGGGADVTEEPDNDSVFAGTHPGWLSLADRPREENYILNKSGSSL